jgi:hypothetical protein
VVRKTVFSRGIVTKKNCWIVDAPSSSAAS